MKQKVVAYLPQVLVATLTVAIVAGLGLAGWRLRERLAAPPADTPNVTHALATNAERATLGASQSRFDAVISNLQTAAENQSAARSRISAERHASHSILDADAVNSPSTGATTSANAPARSRGSAGSASLTSTACGAGRNKGWIQPLPAAICQINNSSATLNKPSASG